MLKVYLHKLHDNIDLHHYTKLLSSNEMERSEGINNAQRKKSYILSRALLRTHLSNITSIDPKEIVIDTKKPKPALKHPSLYIEFNISHNMDSLVMIFSDFGAVGIDVESTQRKINYHRLIDKHFHQEEIQLFKPEESIINFLKIWTLKEACTKLKGLGMFTSFKLFKITCLDPLSIPTMPDIHLHQWEVNSLIISAASLNQDFSQIEFIQSDLKLSE